MGMDREAGATIDLVALALNLENREAGAMTDLIVLPLDLILTLALSAFFMYWGHQLKISTVLNSLPGKSLPVGAKKLSSKFWYVGIIL